MGHIAMKDMLPFGFAASLITLLPKRLWEPLAPHPPPPPHSVDEKWDRQESISVACLMFPRAAVGVAGKGENNEASADKSKLPSTSAPAFSFIPSRACSSRMVTHRVRHMSLQPPPHHALHHHLTQQRSP